jgi:hypothetical protein
MLINEFQRVKSSDQLYNIIITNRTNEIFIIYIMK